MGMSGTERRRLPIRAAFKAVQENKQVVYLVPTTILAQQHYNTFVQRMKEFPVRDGTAVPIPDTGAAEDRRWRT